MLSREHVFEVINIDTRNILRGKKTLTHNLLNMNILQESKLIRLVLKHLLHDIVKAVPPENIFILELTKYPHLPV